jgi:phage gpG-like protein
MQQRCGQLTRNKYQSNINPHDRLWLKWIFDTGNLGRSIQFLPRDGSLTIESDLPYSSAHNEGTSNARRSHNVRIPQRQFIGEDPKLTAAIEKKITEEISKALNK